MQGIGHAIVIGNIAQCVILRFIVTFGDFAHSLLDHALHALGVNISNDDDCLTLWAVPVLIK